MPSSASTPMVGVKMSMVPRLTKENRRLRAQNVALSAENAAFRENNNTLHDTLGQKLVTIDTLLREKSDSLNT